MYNRVVVEEYYFNAQRQELTAWLFTPATGKRTKTVIDADTFGYYLFTEGSGHAYNTATDIAAFIAGAPTHRYVCATIERHLNEEALKDLSVMDMAENFLLNAEAFLGKSLRKPAPCLSAKDQFMEMREMEEKEPEGWPSK